MILMYHHVCPRESIPDASSRFEQEGWAYNIEPVAFERQLRMLMNRGLKFVSLKQYVSQCREGQIAHKTATITFDDGWLDNVEHAFPILARLGLPATVFVVSREIASVPENRRMSSNQLKDLSGSGVTIGGHTRSHVNLTKLSRTQMRDEIRGCKDDLEQLTGEAVDFFAYPGGRFNRAAAEATAEAGYEAACSVIGGGINSSESLFWLFRDTLSANDGGIRDRIYLNVHARKILHLRAQRRLAKLIGA